LWANRRAKGGQQRVARFKGVGLVVDRLIVDEILRATISGATKPFVCRLNDDQLYVLKGRSAQARGCIAEVVAAALGRAFSLPIPSFALADVPLPLVEAMPEARSSLGHGVAFASQYVDGLQPLSISAMGPSWEHTLARVFLFDHWIMNEDRTGTEHGGNPNLFFRSERQDVVVIDHNLAFDPTYNPENNVKLHICREFWHQTSQDMLQLTILKSEMLEVLGSLESVFECLPAEWIDMEPAFIPKIEETLHRCERDQFWSEIKW